ncbi:rhodocoxin reductase [mine drainage metagenome]|uniref:Rhodocoxin reductase n=1 Tax=mine drainage metagenome TaxID=410659 RepID=A0A1J5Q8G7_9ZZZZ
MPVVVVGGGLGALRTAESLATAGYSGEIVVVSDEQHHPYNRPPLSKEALKGGIEAEVLEFKRKPSIDAATWILGDGAESVNLANQSLRLNSGREISFDGIVIATGIRPRRLGVPGPIAGRHTLRTIDDAKSLRSALNNSSSLLVVGAGFIGCEVAATARTLGLTVKVVAIDEEPMIRPLGTELARELRRRHESKGVEFHLGVGIEAFLGDDFATGVRLSDGSEHFADVIVEAIGSLPNTEWLSGNGLDLSDGVLVETSVRVIGTDIPAVAVGDIARYPHELFDSTPRRIEHWNLPTETGRRAGKTLAALLAHEEPTLEPVNFIPTFWSDQYEFNIQSFGMLGIADRMELSFGEWDGELVVEYFRGDVLVGVVGIDSVPHLVPYRNRLMKRA